LSFKIWGQNEQELRFIPTDKLGNNIKIGPFAESHEIISDYCAKVENLFNFDIKIMKTTTVSKFDLINCWREIVNREEEQKLNQLEILNIG
jgi:hypothetical protein